MSTHQLASTSNWRDWLVSSGFHALLGATLVWGVSHSPKPNIPLALDVSVAWAPPEPPAPPAPAIEQPPSPPPALPKPAKVKSPAPTPAAVQQTPPQVIAPPLAPVQQRVAPDTSVAAVPAAPAPAAAPATSLASANPAPQSVKAAPPSSSTTSRPADTSRWQAQLESMLLSYKQYPMVARRMRQEGIVTVEAHFSPLGELTFCVVAISSGFKSLDEAALALVRKTAEAVRTSHQPGRNAELRIPIAFELKES